VIEGRRRSIGPFEVRRVLPFAKRQDVGVAAFALVGVAYVLERLNHKRAKSERTAALRYIV
jgi:hypothetical protein